MSLRLTKLESDILAHRLEVDDCLHEMFNDSDDTVHWSESDVYTACQTLLASLPMIPALDTLTACQIDCLEDAVNGSTYLGTHFDVAGEPFPNRQRVQSVYRAGCALADKLGNHIGRTLVYPKH